MGSARVNSGTDSPPALPRWVVVIPILISAAIFFFHLSVIQRNAVNIPYWDDWAAFSGDDHPASVDAAWLFARHNEHRMATLKLFIWTQFQVNGWNIRTHLLLAFLIYGLCVVLLTWCCARWMQAAPWLMPPFVPFLLTPLSWFNHFMAYTASVHIWLLCFLIGVYLLFEGKQRWLWLLIGCLSLVLAIYTWAAGFVTAFIVLIAFSIFKAIRARRAGDIARRRELFQLVMSLLTIGAALLFWLRGYQKPAHHPPLTPPYKLEFWSFFSNVVASGMGVQRVSTAVGIVCLLLVVVPICGIIWRKKSKLTLAEWAVVATVLALLANQCAVTMGRAGFGIGDSKNVEYTEIGVPFVMLSIVSWYFFLETRKQLRTVAMVTLWLFFCGVFWHKWGDFGIYRKLHDERVISQRCVQDYYAGRGDGHCPTTYPADRSIAPFLEQGKRLNASFYRDAITTIEVAKPDKKPSSK
jgi:hypothetical protein